MTKPIKALLLAAGMGTRLRPLTLKIPKCLVKIDNKCLLQIWLDKLFLIGCKEVLINTHYLHEEVENFILTMIKPEYDNWKGKEDYEKRFLEVLSKLFQ